MFGKHISAPCGFVAALVALAVALAACTPRYESYTPSPTAGAISGGPGYSYRTERPVGTPASAAAPASIAEAAADCERQYDQRKLKTATAAVQCLHTKLREMGAPLNDADRLLMAKQLELAEKVDHRRLTKAEARLQYEEYRTTIKERIAGQAMQATEVRQQQEQAIALERQAEASRRAAANAQATNQLLGAAALLGAGQGYYAPFLQRGVITCNRNGTVTTCY